MDLLSRYLPKSNIKSNRMRIFGNRSPSKEEEEERTALELSQLIKNGLEVQIQPYYHDNYYFRDGIRKIYYILVISSSVLRKTVQYNLVYDYLLDLGDVGLEFEFERGTKDQNLIFVKVHASTATVRKLAETYDLDLTNSGHNNIPCGTTPDIFETFLDKNNGDIFERKNMLPSSSEVIYLINKLLEDPISEDDKERQSLRKMLQKKYIHDAYPLHDGPWQWPEGEEEFEEVDSEVTINIEGTYNDRQLLTKYWANFGMWYKKQPLNLIAKYFGSEVSFYFAFMGIYNRHLIFGSVGALITLIVLVPQMLYGELPITDQICEGKDFICPGCANVKFCPLIQINNYCSVQKVAHLLDNHITNLNAIYIILWITTFHKVWLRNENFRMVKWNVRNTQVEYSARAQYKEKAEQQISVATGELEWKITTCKSVFHYSLTTLICFLTVVVICSFVFLVILLKIVLIRELYLINNDAVVSDVIGIICSAFFQIAFIKIFAIFYKFLAEKLSEIENPKTQRAYDDSVVYKRYFLGFVNNYIPIIYTAFIKNNFYDFPPKKVGYWNSNKLDYRKWDEDICSPRTCMLALLVQISSLMLWRCIIGNFSQVSRLWFYKISGLGSDSQLPSWENEYKLKKWDTLDGEYMELFIQCGYVVFFIIGFPFAPVMALINNIIQVRGDAMKMIKYYRRPVPKQNSSIGAWGKILAMMPYGAILTNSLIIAFTTDFVPRLLFQASSDSSLNYFIDYFFGDYHITHHSVFYNQTDKKRCITRFIELERPSKSEKELLEIDTLTMNIRLGRFAVIMLFEHVAVMFSAMVAYCIPDVTTIIKEFVYLERYEAKQIQLSLLRSDIIKRRSESHQNLRDNVSSVFDMEAFKKEREVELNKLKRN